MLGLAFMFVGVIYIAISVWLIKLAMRQAEKRGIARWKWGVPVGFVMYLLIFWDHIPTLVAHQYYCKTEAGFTVYKTLDEWKQENPGVAETLTYEDKVKSSRKNNKIIYYMNERFDSIRSKDSIFLSVVRFKSQIIDKKNSDILAEYAFFRSGGAFQNANDFTDYKIWLANTACDSHRNARTQFGEYLKMAKRIGDFDE